MTVGKIRLSMTSRSNILPQYKYHILDGLYKDYANFSQMLRCK